MKLSKYLLIACTAGLLVPISWMALYSFGPVRLTRNVVSNLIILPLWPSFVLLMVDPMEETISLPMFAVALNVVTYAVLGALAWWTREKLNRGLWLFWLVVFLIATTILAWASGII